MKAKAPITPPMRDATARAAIRAKRSTGIPCSARDLATAARCAEKDVPDQLAHLERSLKGSGGRLGIDPAACLACGHVFADRRKYSPPSACPACRSERMAPPCFHLQPTLA